MLGAQYWSVYVPYDAVEYGAAMTQLEQIDIAKQVFAMYPDVFEPTFTADDVERAFAAGKIGSMLGMEGGHAIENSLGALRAFFDMGVRYMTITHGTSIDWADAGTGENLHDGLTAFGEEVIREMNWLGMLVDLSHTSPETMHDALDVTEAPVIFSHSSARAVTDHPRNVPDDVLRRLPDNGGVVMVTFVTSFVNENPDEASLSDVADHIDHVKNVAGIDHVGIGGDYDGHRRHTYWARERGELSGSVRRAPPPWLDRRGARCPRGGQPPSGHAGRGEHCGSTPVRAWSLDRDDRGPGWGGRSRVADVAPCKPCRFRGRFTLDVPGRCGRRGRCGERSERSRAGP